MTREEEKKKKRKPIRKGDKERCKNEKTFYKRKEKV